MVDQEAAKAQCPKCRNDMLYVTALPHPKAPQMLRTTFVCYTCNQTRAYMLSTEMAAAYANPAEITVSAQ